MAETTAVRAGSRRAAHPVTVTRRRQPGRHRAVRGGTVAAVAVTPAPLPDLPAARPGTFGMLLARAALARELIAFATVGGVCVIVDLAVFHFLNVGARVDPITAKVGSTVVASVLAYIGNRQWTYRHRPGRGWRKELPAALAVNGLGLLVSEAVVGSVALAHPHASPTALDAANLGGIVLSTGLRFWMYRRWVFAAAAPAPAVAVA